MKTKKKKKPKLIVILGPTASGKTELAIKLAKRFNGEIVSADSRQICREMDIGTAKHSKKEIETIPHHLIGVIKPNKDFNVAIYKRRALKAIQGLIKRKKIPFLVGGTGLYIKAIVDNIKFPKVLANKKLRGKLEKKTKEELFKMYKKIDPKGAKFIDKKNKRRLIRAIEVCKVTKKPFWQQRDKGKPLFDALQIGIKLPKSKLEKRVKKRVERIIKQGLEKEVEKLVKKYSWNLPALQTIGYQEWSSFAKASEDEQDYFSSLTQKQTKEIKEKIVLHTLQFAKRQMTWFKKDKRIKWIDNYSQAEKLVKEFLS